MFLSGMIYTYLIVVYQVIKKIMKMDAAEPFNVPVNPVELGIPVSLLSMILMFSYSFHWMA